MEQAVAVSSDQIRKSIADTGKMVFYGIYFDTDKATLKAESEPTPWRIANLVVPSGPSAIARSSQRPSGLASSEVLPAAMRPSR